MSQLGQLRPLGRRVSHFRSAPESRRQGRLPGSSLRAMSSKYSPIWSSYQSERLTFQLNGNDRHEPVGGNPALALPCDPSYEYEYAEMDWGPWCRKGQSGSRADCRRYWLPT